MSGFRVAGRVFCVLALTAGAAHADLVGAQKAYAAQEYSRAFELYRQIAELGNVAGQENLAAMYVDGQGVKRNNVLGYAWALIARENGANAAMQNIIDQLEPHLTDASRVRVAEITKEFGKAALQERLLPAPLDPSQKPELPKPGESCTFSRPANPDDYYPKGAIAQGISGYVILEVTVMPDGRARNPRISESVPAGAFDEAGRRVSFASVFKPRVVAGNAVPCNIKYKIKFFVRSPGAEASSPGRIPDNSDKTFDTAKSAAKAGDPLGQWLYALLLMQRPADPDHDHALDWAVRAAQAGVADAQFEVGHQLINRKWLPDGEHERKKGLAWFAIAANSGQADAQVALAVEALSHDPDAAAFDEAQDWLDKPGASGIHDGKLYLAALLAAGPNAGRRDPGRAIKLLDEDAWQFESDPTSFEIRAAAHAQLGEFDAAKREQKRAISAAKNLGWDLKPLNERMANYEKGTAWMGSLIQF
jgi:TonB family protein